MLQSKDIAQVLANSPSVELLKWRHRDLIIQFFIRAFKQEKNSLTSENVHLQLADFLEFKELEQDEDHDIQRGDTYEDKAKKYIRKWADNGFLTNYRDERGTIYYELSAHTNKTLDWLASLKKKEFVGAESKFKDIYNQLKELVEYTDENVKTRLRILKKRRKELDQQIKQLEKGKAVPLFQDYQVIEKYQRLNQSAKELLSDFKEVEDNFKTITKEIYQKHANTDLNKGDVLGFTFDALDELRDSHQGRSFYAFWRFLMDRDLQEEWKGLSGQLYQTLAEKEVAAPDKFLKNMKGHLYVAGQKVSRANDKMADKLSRIIRENNINRKAALDRLIQEIKDYLGTISKTKKVPNISIILDTNVRLNLPFERRLTYELKNEVVYDETPTLAANNILESAHLGKILTQDFIDKKLLRRRIRDVLNVKAQTTLLEVIEQNGGIQKGLAELFGYIGILKEFKYSYNPKKEHAIVFDRVNHKSITVPEII
ncbi:MAG: DUF3375 domain-containing protein, partial [Bacteroidota bacterium]